MNSDCDACGFFDDVVIGSSPLMLLQAEYLARNNRTVCVVDRQLQFGGVWGVAHLSNGQITECAVHLLENYPGVYKYLEEVSGCEFVKLDPQPVGVFRNGLTVSLSNPMKFWFDWAYMFLGLMYDNFKSLLRNGINEERISISRNGLKSHVRGRQRFAIFRQTYFAPKHGWDDFICNLIERLNECEVAFRTMDVSEINQMDENRWLIKSVSGKYLIASQIHCTASTNLRLIGPKSFAAREQDVKERRSLLVEITADDIGVLRTYAEMWGDPLISRVARVETQSSIESTYFFLVELRDSVNEQSEDLIAAISSCLKRTQILLENGSFRTSATICCTYVTSHNQLSTGHQAVNFNTYYSSGKLSSAISRWLKSRRIFTP